MPAKHYILATAGHVDHGKSSLVKALTGVDPDRLPEEKQRGITIDLGFAHLDLPSTEPGGDCYSLGIIDVPGHEDFVKNMVAGVGSIDLALLVVAGDDGWMPQTEEHLQILQYLGVRRGVIALTKADLCPNVPAMVDAIRERVADTMLASVPVVATSVPEGRGLEELKGALRGVLNHTPEPEDVGKPRLPVDRVFVLRGVGTVVTGTLTGGRLATGQTVIIQPGGRTARIRSLQVHNRDVPASGPGRRTAVNLPDVKAEEEIRRGDVLTLEEFGPACRRLDVLLERSSRLARWGAGGGGVRLVRDRARVRIHLGSTNVPASVSFPDGRKALEVGGQAIARFHLEAPLFAFVGDRFIVRDWSEQATLAGGWVLDPVPDPSRVDADRLELLRRVAASPEDARLLIEAEVAVRRGVSRSGLGRRVKRSAEVVAEEVEALVAEGRVERMGGWVMEPGWWRGVLAKAEARIELEHRAHPERPGLALAELKGALEGELPDQSLFAAVVEALCARGFVPSGVSIRAPQHAAALPPHLAAAGTRVRAALSAKPMEPPSRKEVAPDAATQQALRFLVETGQAVELGSEVVVLAEAYRQAVERIRAHLRSRGSATASDLRQVVGSSRRIVIPLLERLDKEGVTRREGDLRILRQGSSI